jgi:hypothetical protein
MGRDKGVALLVLLAVVATSRKASPAPASPRPPAPPRGGPQALPRVLTGGGASWAGERATALARAGVRGDAALSILAMWDFETAGGRAEWNFNVGNLKASGRQARVDLGAAGMFRAFESLDAGVAAYLALVQSARFAPCWDKLQAAPTSDDWIRCLGAAGYYESSADTYAAGWRARREALAKTRAVQGDFFGFMGALRAPAR